MIQDLVKRTMFGRLDNVLFSKNVLEILGKLG